MSASASLLGGGIFLTLLIGLWSKIKDFVWKFLSLFICRWKWEGSYDKYGTIYAWDKLKNKKSLAPIYSLRNFGSGKNSKVFIREVGFINLRLIFMGRIPILVNINEDGASCYYGLKPFINHEKILQNVLDHYTSNYLQCETENISNFSVQYIRGNLNQENSGKNIGYSLKGGRDEAVESESEVPTTNYLFEMYERFNIGRRINYSKEEYRQYVTFTKENTRLIDNLYLTNNMIEIKEKLTKWFNHKKWFTDRSIQWKRGFLTYGNPGTGKTSFIVALAEYFNVPVFIFDLSTFTNHDMEKNWERLKTSTPCFVVFEDFDSVFDGRTNIYTQNAMTSKPVSFDCILNILDGAVKFDGIVTFITTNNFDKIDPALGGGCVTRPGRIDYVYEMNGIGERGHKFIAEKIFKDMDNYDHLVSQAMSSCDECQTPAQFKELCINMALETYNN